jgi:hypothetical protein
MLTFASEEEKEEIRKRGLDHIQPEAARLGEKYRHEIETEYLAPVVVKMVGPDIGQGLFAKESIPEGAYIGEYIGIVRTNHSLSPISDYCFRYPVPDSIGRDFVVDAICGNLTRFINHSFKPNLIPKYAYVNGFYHLVFFAGEPIVKGTQLTYNYGRHYWALRGPPMEL